MRSFFNNLKGMLTRRSSVTSSEVSSIIRNPPSSSSQIPITPTTNTSSNSDSSFESKNIPNTPSSSNLTSSVTQRRSSTSLSFQNLGIKIPSTPQNKSITSPLPREKLQEENFVRVRIWTSKTSSGDETLGANAMLTGGNVGHATLETKNTYASIWPATRPITPFESKMSEFITNPEKDIEYENSKPDLVITFYSLDSKAIDSFFDKVKSDNTLWSLIGNTLDEKSYSCSSLTMKLLEVGGINNLANLSRKVVSPTSNFVISPNNLVRQLSLANYIEQVTYPEAADLKAKNNNIANINRESFLVTFKGELITMNTIRTHDTPVDRADQDESSPQHSTPGPTTRF